MTQIRPATPGTPKQMSANEHNTMASAVNYVVENQRERGAVIHNKRNNIFYPVYATQFLRSGCLVQLDGPITNINSGNGSANFPTSSYTSWMTNGQTAATVRLAAVPATYASPAYGDSTNSQWSNGYGVYGVVNDPIMKGSVGYVQVAGICAARIIINSLDHNFCWPAANNIDNGHAGSLTSGYAGRPGYQMFGKPEKTDGRPFTWAYILLNLTTSPMATRIMGKVYANFNSSSSTFLMVEPTPLNGLITPSWKAADFGGVPVYNTLRMEGVTNFRVFAEYNVWHDRWEAYAIECGD